MPVSREKRAFSFFLFGNYFPLFMFYREKNILTMQENKKIRICAVGSDSSGCWAHRVLWPHKMLQENFGDKFDVDLMHLKDIPRENLEDFLKQYDILFFHKQLDLQYRIIDMAKFLNLLVICDLDDSYRLGMDHPSYASSVREKWADTIIGHARKADCVITTTPIYEKELKLLNDNVYVLPNAIDDTLPMFNVPKVPSDRIRFGIICGSAHQKDIELMTGISTLPKSIMDRLTYYCGGFDTNGITTIYDPKTGNVTRRQMTPEQSVWNVFERFLTNNYKTISPEHRNFLKQYLKMDDPFAKNESYNRGWTLDINNYARHYQNVDVLLAPLKENDFNRRKSDLKVAECVYTNTAIIASDYGPYQLHLIPYLEKGMKINPEGNALLVDPSKNHKQWAKYIQYVVEHPECIQTMVTNLRKGLLEHYSLKNVTNDRAELYEKLYKEHKQDC